MSNEDIERLEATMSTGFAEVGGAIEQNARAIEQNARAIEQNARAIEQMGRTMHAGFETLADLQRETNASLGHLAGRFDHFIETAGHESRTLRRDVDALTTRVDQLESERD